MKLNEFQERAVNHLDGPCVVTSCPGSGKTFVLVERILKLIERGVRPQNILCITFTNKAADEMKERVCKRLGIKKPNFFIGTFHALCANILRKMGRLGGYPSNFTILDDKDQIDLIMQISRQMDYSINRGDAQIIAYAINYYRDQLEDDSWLEERLTNVVFENIAKEYFKKSKLNSLVDFSGLIFDAIKLIENCEDIRNKLQTGFKYILVDETQDTNGSQYHLINLLGDKWRNIMLIGDQDQSIYCWRGARYTNIQSFINRHTDCTIIPLSKNYRSTPQIVKTADRLIKHNIDRIANKFETDNASGEPVRCYEMPNQTAEATWVANQIEKLIRDGGWDPEDITVLYRINKMSEPVEQALSFKGVAYDVIGGWNFYDRKEVRDCLSMLKFLLNKKDGIAFHRIASLLKGVGDTTIGKIENRSNEKNIDIVEATKEIKLESNSVNIRSGCDKIVEIFSKEYDFSKPGSCILSLISDLNFEKYLHNNFAKNAIERVDNVNQVIEAASRFEGYKDGLERYLQNISLVTGSDKEIEGNKISLMSLHAAKGLEFPIVFIIGVENNILPHSRAMVENENGIEEERRLCYVGITRAKKHLYITYCKKRYSFGKFGNAVQRNVYPSVFLKEAGLIKGNNDG